VSGELAVEVRCAGRRGRCRRLIATLHLFDIDEQHHRLRHSWESNWSVPSDLTGAVMLCCPRCSGNVGQREVDVFTLLSGPLEEYRQTGKMAIALLHP
jgi:hypothetical protein